MSRSLTTMVFLSCSLLLTGLAQADVVVGASGSRFGTLLVSGKGNVDDYGRENTSFEGTLKNVGTKTEDEGSISGTLNTAQKVRAGTYWIKYSNTWMSIEIKEGQKTSIQLQKVRSVKIADTSKVSLINLDPDLCSMGDDGNQYCNNDVGSWSPKGGYRYQCKEYPKTSGVFPFYVQTTGERCGNMYDSSMDKPWSTSVFWVLPGKYKMTWTFNDGTTHSETDIIVK